MPLFTNNENLRVVDMCKTFDEEFFTDKRDDSKLFRYLYMIIYATTLKEKNDWFKKYEDYDKYATYSARVLYMRFLKKLKKGERIKSVLNYFHSSMNGLRVNFQKEEFSGVLNPEFDNFDNDLLVNNFSKDLSNQYFYYDKNEDLTYLFENANLKAKEVVNESPYKNNKIISHRLYLSILLTFISNLTLNRDSKKKYLKKVNKDSMEGENFLIELLEKEKDEEPILWKLDSSMREYVKLCVNKLKNKISKELRELSDYYVLPEDVVLNVMASAYGDRYGEYKEEE